MKILIAVLKDFVTFFNVKTKQGKRRTLIAGALALVAYSGFLLLGSTPPETETVKNTPEVAVRSVSELAAGASFDTIGKVEAVSEANLQTETGGRVTAVNVKVGQAVSAGAVLATIENSAQRAALVQAQGSYEAALAASAQSGLGVDEAKSVVSNAKNSAVNTYRQSYNTVNSIIYNNVDTFFSSPQGSLPGVKIDGAGYTSTLNSERIAYQKILTDWQTRSNAITAESNLDSEFVYAKNQVERTIALLDIFISIFNQPGGAGGYTDAELQSYSTSFTALRSTLISTRSSLDGALAGIKTAKETVQRAELSAAGGGASASDAQIKIALGSLQSAQSNYQKTIVRSPIQGVVNAFYISAGDYVAPGQPAGIVANNNGLQIKTFVTEVDSANLTVGDAVSIEGGASGVITAKAAALDPTNGKVAVVIGVNPDSGLTNGATIKVTFAQVSATKPSEKVLVPLSALKITSEGSFVFTVVDNKLVATAVTQGALYGENIEILSGVTKETRIVTDARGLKEGQEVTIKN